MIANLAVVLNSQRRFEEAEALYKLSLALREKILGADHPDTALSLHNLASFYSERERHGEAVPMQERSLAIAEERLGREHPQVAAALSNLASSYIALGHYPEAGPLLDRSLNIRTQVFGENHPLTTYSLGVLAKLREKQNDFKGSYAFSQRATEILQRRLHQNGGDASESAPNRAELLDLKAAPIREVLMAYRLALESPDRAASLMDEGFRLGQWVHQSEAAAALSQMSARFARGETKLADLVRRRQDLSWRRQALDRELIKAVGSPPELRNAEAEEKLRAEIAQIGVDVAEIDKTLGADFPDFAALSNPEPISILEAQAQLREGEVLYQIIVAAERSIAWAITKTDAQWRELPIGEKALANEVEALRCGLDTAAWSVTVQDAAGARVVSCERLLGRGRPERSNLPFDIVRAHKLYQTLFGPLEDLIKGRRLFVVPTGPLTTLPLQVLVTKAPRGGDPNYAAAAWLGSRQAITVLPSVPSLKAARVAAKSSPAPKPFVSFSNPLISGEGGLDRRAWSRQSCAEVETAGGSQIARAAAPIPASSDYYGKAATDVAVLKSQRPLPETADEACAVARSLGAEEADVHLGARANEAALKSLSADGTLRGYRILHFATHGLIAGETKIFARSKTEPSLLLTPPDVASEENDGLLTASEVAGLALNAEAVVLSACNTAGASGAPNAEALSGLARAFFYAGARALLVTHWYVNSDAAVELVTEAFAERKREPALSLAEAMRRAMVKSIGAAGKRAHPAYWAHFVVVAAN